MMLVQSGGKSRRTTGSSSPLILPSPLRRAGPMLNGLSPAAGGLDIPAHATLPWPDEGMRWVQEARKSAPGLDWLLTWAFRINASRIRVGKGAGRPGRHHYHTGPLNVRSDRRPRRGVIPAVPCGRRP